MLTLNLTPIFTLRGITKPYAFLVKEGFSPNTAHRLINSETRVFKLDHIEKLCTVLVCEPNDLLLWTPPKNQKVNPDFPLSKLIQTKNNLAPNNPLAQIPYKELKNITNTIIEANNLKK
jgi:DNA-binding Xre family transcriptional regulator